MYVYRPEERFKSPPILPPHLLQVILNKDTNISVCNSILPTESHTGVGKGVLSAGSLGSPWLGSSPWHFLGEVSLFPFTTLIWPAGA